MATTPRRWVSPNIPSAPPATGGGGLKFPKDLTAGGRNFYTSIIFQRYSMGGFGGFGSFGGGGGSVTLPIPRKINDVQTVIWEETSIVSAGLAAANLLGTGFESLGNIGLGAANLRLNPALIMLFKQPNFKEWNLQWTLAPNSQDESQAIANIVKEFKRSMSPGKAGPFYTYPAVAQVRFFPSENFLTRLKPAAIMAVQTDFTAVGQPSFFNSGAPTVVNLTVSLKETELWTSDAFI